MTKRDGTLRTTGPEARGPDGAAIRGWRAAAEEGLASAIGSRAAYDLRRSLPRLIAFDARELSNAGPALDAAIKARLERALRAERQRGLAGHWTYDINRHIALRQALAAETGR